MSQNSLVLPTTGTVSGLQMAQDINNALDTLNTLGAGAAAPASPEAGQIWHDTTNNLLKIRSLDNTSWIPFLQLNEGSYLAMPNYTSQITGIVNRIINGAMDIDQANEGASYTINTANNYVYTLDQWEIICKSSTASGILAQRVADAPAGLINSLKLTVGTGAGSVGTTDVIQITQPLEGVNVSDLSYGTSGAAPCSLSFWAKSSVAGTFSVLLANAGGARTYVTTFTIASAGTWQQVKIANIPGDQSGSWPTNNTQGLSISVVPAVGTGEQTTTLNAWQSGAFIGANTQSNGVLTTTGATFQLTGVMLNAGPFCLPYEKRPVQQELLMCQRYFYKTFPQGTAAAQNAGFAGALASVQGYGASSANQASNELRFPVSMRTTPSVTTYNPAAANAQFRNQTRAADASSLSPNIQSAMNWSFTFTTSAGSASGDGNALHLTANARM